MTLDTPIVAGSDHLSSNLAGEEVILSLETGVYYGLDEVGARIYALLSETTTARAICDRLEAEYDVDRETMEADVLDLIQALRREGIVGEAAAASM